MEELIRAENLQMREALGKISSTGCRQIYPCTGDLKCVKCISDEALQLPCTARLAKRMEREIGDYKEALERIAGDRNCECCDNGVEEMPCTCFDFSPRECAENVLTKHALDAEDK